MEERINYICCWFYPTSNIHYGGVAQLGEHLPCKQGVTSSNLVVSTIKEVRNQNLEVRKINKLENLFLSNI